ncbi:MAG TPA: hypothetical protein VJL87_02950, partial [Bdellovibrionota bacterium]|nr:hypothetical protein [Bdellovibrionota bacterium]
DATYDATDDATFAATDDDDKWWKVKGRMFSLAKKIGVGIFGLKCAANAYNMWQGGNQWSAWVCFLSFFRHVAKLEIDYSKFDYLEKAAIHGGPRIMHPDFCMISDRPIFIKVDDRNRPHCLDGPFCKWRDGSQLFAIHGVKVPAKYCLTKAEDIKIEDVLSESNIEVRMIVLQKIGMDNVYKKLGGKRIDTCSLSKDKVNNLVELDFNGLKVRGLFVTWADKYAKKTTFIPVPTKLEDFNVRWQEIYGKNWEGNLESASDVTFWTFGIPPNTTIHAHT